MKTSTIIRYLAQTLYWFNCILFVSWIFTSNDVEWILLLMAAVLVLAGFVFRIPKLKVISVLLHTTALMIPIIFRAWANISLPAMIVGILMIAFSVISKCADLKTMSRASLFGKFSLVFIYCLGSVMNYRYMFILFAGIFVFFVLEFLQNNFEKNEGYIDNLCDTAIVDINKTKNMANLMTVLSSLIIALVCGLITLLGKIPPAAALSGWLNNKFSNILSFLKRITLAPFQDAVVTEKPTEQESWISETWNDTSDRSIERYIFTAIAIIAVVAVLVGGIYLLVKKIYKYYLELQHTGYMDEEVSIKKEVSEKKRKIRPKDLDKSYNNRKALRRIYKKRIKGGKSGRRDDFISRTPYEQRDKTIADGNNVSTDFVDMYERARYSNEAVTKEDVRKMSKME